MAAKDIAEKLLEEHNDVFADIFNVLLFKKDFVNPEELSDAPHRISLLDERSKGMQRAAQGCGKAFK